MPQTNAGCLADHPKCDVIFQLNNRIGGPNVKSLGLSALDMDKVEFVRTVLANGSSKDDAAFWLMPQINR